MREFNLLGDYPQPDRPRVVARDLRTIHHRLVALRRDEDFFDGDRDYGYGGFRYDGRWVPIAERMCQEYGLDSDSSVLQINCEKGFLLHDLQQACDGLDVVGTETSTYAIDAALDSVKGKIQLSPPDVLPFPERHFDCVIALGVVYTQTLEGAVKVLSEIQRVGKGASFITLASYETEEEFFLFRDWTLLGAQILKKEEWREVLEHADYVGDYYFTSAESLNLVRRVD
jgi:SAM-dependent methyltransferase